MGVIFKNHVMYGAGDIEISPICYSEEEREIGVWTDGKPLYQKTVIFVGGTNGTINIPHGISSIDTLVDIQGTCSDTYGNGDIRYPISRLSSDNNHIYFQQIDATNITYNVPTVFSNRIINVQFTAQYTKTTDTPGSGIWTPSGVPACHYNTAEQVIGTWIDGSTVYEKTFTQDLTNTAMNTLLDVADVSSLNIDKICSIVGHAYVSNASMTRWLSQGANLIYQYNVATKKINVVQTQAAGLNLTAYVTVGYTKSSS